MTGEPLTPEELEFVDRYSGATPLPADEMEQIIEAGRLAARDARIPVDVPHIWAIVAAFPPDSRNPLSVSRFIENATIDYLGGEVGVREYLEAGLDPEPVLALAREADQWGM